VILIRDRLRSIRWHLTGRCVARGCGRLMVLHTRRQRERCYDTPLDVALTARGWLLAHGLDAEVVDAWCQANGVDPDAIVEPVVPVSMHAHSA
jgi:hypothetical protein